MTPEQIDALAAACERAAAVYEMKAASVQREAVHLYNQPERAAQLERWATMEAALRAHARALRDGRVTVSEEANNG